MLVLKQTCFYLSIFFSVQYVSLFTEEFSGKLCDKCAGNLTRCGTHCIHIYYMGLHNIYKHVIKYAKNYYRLWLEKITM